MLISHEASDLLKALGGRLREERLKRNETQQTFAARIGTSVPTLLRMEQGDEKVQFGFWVAALEILDRATDINKIMKTDDLFEQYEQKQNPKRQRASRRRSSG